MTRPLSQLERSMLLYMGMPARDAARAVRIPVARVLELRADLRARGALPALPSTELEPGAGQLSFDDTCALMRSNEPPAGL